MTRRFRQIKGFNGPIDFIELDTDTQTSTGINRDGSRQPLKWADGSAHYKLGPVEKMVAAGLWVELS